MNNFVTLYRKITAVISTIVLALDPEAENN